MNKPLVSVLLFASSLLGSNPATAQVGSTDRYEVAELKKHFQNQAGAYASEPYFTFHTRSAIPAPELLR